MRAALVEIRHPRENKALLILMSREGVAIDVASSQLYKWHLKVECTMIDLKMYIGLPDGMRSHEVKLYIEKLVETIQTDSSPENISVFLEALNELADRQWHTYEQIDSKLSKKVEEVLMASITTAMSLEDAENVTSIIAHLGLFKALNHLKQVAKNVASEAVREELKSSIEELATTVSDPYSEM